MSNTHASTHFKDPSHREASRLRRALHLKHLDRPKFFISLLPSVVILPKLFFFCFFLIEIFPAVEPTKKCRGRCVRIQNADDVDHFRSRFPASAPSCRSILRGLRPPPPFENRFHPRCQCRPASVTKPDPGKMNSLLTFDLLLVLVIVGALIATVSWAVLERPQARCRYYPNNSNSSGDGTSCGPIHL